MKLLLLRCEFCYAAFVLMTGEKEKAASLEKQPCRVCRKSSPKLIGEIDVSPKSA